MGQLELLLEVFQLLHNLPLLNRQLLIHEFDLGVHLLFLLLLVPEKLVFFVYALKGFQPLLTLILKDLLNDLLLLVPPQHLRNPLLLLVLAHLLHYLVPFLHLLLNLVLIALLFAHNMLSSNGLHQLKPPILSFPISLYLGSPQLIIPLNQLLLALSHLSNLLLGLLLPLSLLIIRISFSCLSPCIPNLLLPLRLLPSLPPLPLQPPLHPLLTLPQLPDAPLMLQLLPTVVPVQLVVVRVVRVRVEKQARVAEVLLLAGNCVEFELVIIDLIDRFTGPLLLQIRCPQKRPFNVGIILNLLYGHPLLLLLHRGISSQGLRILLLLKILMLFLEPAPLSLKKI